MDDPFKSIKAAESILESVKNSVVATTLSGSVYVFIPISRLCSKTSNLGSFIFSFQISFRTKRVLFFFFATKTSLICSIK